GERGRYANRAMHRTYLILTILTMVAGCSPRNSNAPNVGNDATSARPGNAIRDFEAVWRSIDHPQFKIYVGQKRWFVFREGPTELRVWGKIDLVPSSKMPSVLDATLREFEADDQELLTQLNERGSIDITFVRDGDFLRVFAADVGEWKLEGVYRYESDDTPAKGYDNVHDWGTDA
ncbi:hypothetical protein LOC67_22705, partial [Stieleria sp. JC731]|uniref:hypothetical protein n=1 Tax=Stieleria sp. JC731 TaxID=2894195 RepID=UPI001E372AA5